ncbi:MAG TPA: right-handed parallel beta-helix repeat-containing protein [Rummeliibacillus sp.]|nr:right-handed parallel beta-helix repeat-containing protein [Rummeliibacillus sp.]
MDKNNHIDATGINANVNALNVRDSDLSSLISMASSKFVSVTGNDSNAGTKANPFKTIQYAINQAMPGDTIYLLDGTYRERVVLPKSGSKDRPIKLVNYPGASPIIDGQNIVWDGGYHGGLISIDGKSNWIFEGIKLMNASAMGFGMEKNIGGSENVTIRNCSVIGAVTSGIYFEDAKNIIIENCYIENVCKNLLNECITIQNVDGFEVFNCTIKNSYKEGINAKNGSRNGSIHDCYVDNSKSIGIYVDAYSREQYNIKVFNNIITGINGAGISTGVEEGGTLQDVLIRNNIVYGCLRGYNVAAHNGDSGLPYSMKNIYIHNNISFDVTFTGVFITSDVKNLIIENNILFSNQAGYGIHVFDLAETDLAELTIRNNFFRDMIKSDFLPLGTDYILLSQIAGANDAFDKVFKDATGKTGKRDFTLALNSPAKGKGYKGVDMGAYDGYQKGDAIELELEIDKVFSTLDTRMNLLETTIYDNLGIPTTGKFKLGKIVYNPTPVVGGYVGWVCTLAGVRVPNPLTWAVSTPVVKGQYMIYKGKAYICLWNGKTSVSPTSMDAPPASDGIYYDGSTGWELVGTVAIFSPFGLIS